MNTQTSCRHCMSGWDWRTARTGEVEIRTTETPDSPAGDVALWRSLGKVSEVFARITDKAFERSELTWRTELSYSEVERDGKMVTVCNDSDEGIRRIRADDHRRELELLSRVGQSVGMRLDATRWTMLSPNAVLHFQFGPGVTVATDGTQVLLFSFPTFPTECSIVHRSNVVGPVTVTPTRVSEWDYIRNTAGTTEPRERKAPKRDESLKLALAALLS